VTTRLANGSWICLYGRRAKARRSRPEAVAKAIVEGDAGQTGAGVLTAARESATSDKTRSHPQPGSAHVAKAAGEVREKLSARATGRAVERGSNEPWSCSRHVSFAEVDERRPAHHHPPAKSRRERGGSSPAARERTSEANRRRKPDCGGKAARSVAGSSTLHTSGVGALPRKRRDLRGAFVDGRRFGPKKRRALTGSARKRPSASRESGRSRAGARAGRDRERQRQVVNLARGRKRRGEVASLRQEAASAPIPNAGAQRSRERPQPKLGRRRQAHVEPGLDPPRKRHGRAPRPWGAVRSLRRKARAGCPAGGRSGESPTARYTNGSRVLVSQVGCRGE
jgi:hypothetical protein